MTARHAGGGLLPGPGASQVLAGTGRLADELWLLAHDDRTGRPLLHPRAAGLGLAGGLLGELLLGGAIGAEPAWVTVTGAAPPGDDLACRVTGMIATEPAVPTEQPSAVPGWDIIRAPAADAPALAAVIAEAFFDLPPSRWLIPEPDARRRAYPGYFLLYVEHALTAGIVHTTPQRDAAALWLPSECPPPPDYPARLATDTAPWTSRFQKFDELLDSHHPASPPHRHLAILAVRPRAQGHGTGTALLTAYHRRLDQLAMPAYLEASAPRSRLLYQRHGYTDHGPPIRLPDGTPMWSMWREPDRASGYRLQAAEGE